MLAPGAGRFLLPVALLLFLDLVLLLLGTPPLGAAGFGLAAVLVGLFGFFAVFFRDPERRVGEGIVSAADGRIRAVERLGERWLVSVFMNVTDVHVNRLPFDATVEAIDALGEGFRPAYRHDAEANVKRRYRLATSLGTVEVVQITGILARRLVPFVRVGDSVAKGARLGMIVLGSRVDVLLPAERTEPTVRVGDRVVAGVTTIARVRP